jgi:3-oxoacyl-[acyl-carrier protein] reductase
MTMSLSVVVTGCASGIGKHLASRLISRGDRVVATDVNEPALREAASSEGWPDGDRLVLSRLDVRDADAWQDTIQIAVERWGRIDVVFNVAGYLVPVWAHRATAEDVHRTIDVNTKGMIFGTNTAVRQMIHQKAGHVINVASLAGIIPVPGIAIYSASKHAARAYSIAVAQEVRPHNVFVTAVCPTVVKTPMMDIQIDREEAAYTFSGKRALTVDEVVNAILNRALVKKPLELVLDVPRTGQGLAAKLANALPELALRMGSRVRRAGQTEQSRLAERP